MKQILWTLVACLAVGQVASANVGEALFNLVPTMPVSNQDFGDSVAIHGNYVLVGAEDTTVGGVPTAGKAYLFEAATGNLLRDITPTGPPISRAFGSTVAINGNRLVVGAEDEGTNRGAAYVFDTDGNQLFKLLAGDGAANHEFSQALAISGNTVLVGAPLAVGATGVGKAYFFDLSTETPGSTLMGTGFQPADLPSFAEFGTVLDLDGDRAIIGLDRLGLGGAAYVYDTAGNLIRKFTPPINPNTGNPVRGFGRSVAISGNVALIGATPDDAQVNEATEFGRAYLYDIPSGNLLFELVPNDSMPGDLFGDIVSLSGNLALVNARREDVLGIINQAYVFDVSTGRQLLTLDNSGFVAGDEVFEAAALHDGRVVAGVEGFDSPGFSNNGIAVVFDVLFGDYNRDGIVDAADYTVWRNSLGETVARFEGADGNGDMTVDNDDYLLWKAMYGTAAPVPVVTLGGGSLAGQSMPVPEPASAMLLMVSLATLAVRSRTAGRNAAN